MYLKRREFSKLAIAAAAAPLRELFAAKPNSIFDGVVIGTITYSFRSEVPASSEAEPLLKMVVDSGISHIELMPPAAESYAGSPAAAQGRGGGRGGSGAGRGGGRGGSGGGGGRGPAVTSIASGQALPVCAAGNAEEAGGG